MAKPHVKRLCSLVSFLGGRGLFAQRRCGCAAWRGCGLRVRPNSLLTVETWDVTWAHLSRSVRRHAFRKKDRGRLRYRSFSDNQIPYRLDVSSPRLTDRALRCIRSTRMRDTYRTRRCVACTILFASRIGTPRGLDNMAGFSARPESLSQEACHSY
ncbi:hypothetical protein FKP32DRAFT_664673 [Trametes sanguinea]|nr:hypothetical protein FKP32DRAFT_664673 [Trametes sanguinea]